MPYADKQGLYLEFKPEISELLDRFKWLGPTLSAKYLGAALRKAAEPSERALKQIVSSDVKKVTGNLRRAITIKVKRYTRTGNAVALVGFTAAGSGKVKAAGVNGRRLVGKDRAFHAGFIEFGTKERKTKRNIASSFIAFGNFTSKKPRRLKGDAKTRVYTKPKYPRAFLKGSKKNTVVQTGRVMPIRPIKRAWEQTKSSVQAKLQTEMLIALDNSARDTFRS